MAILAGFNGFCRFLPVFAGFNGFCRFLPVFAGFNVCPTMREITGFQFFKL